MKHGKLFNPQAQKVALITGSSQGLGKVIAKKLSSVGYKLILADIKDNTLSSLEGSLFIKTDLKEEEQVKNLITQGMEYFKSIDVIINNARPALDQSLSFEKSMDEWVLAADVILKAPALIAKYAFPYMKKRRYGNIINICSANAFFISHQPASYHAMKAGLVQLTRYLAKISGEYGIRVNAISPGLLELKDKGKITLSNEGNQKIVQTIIPLKRAGTAEEVSDLVLFLLSENSAYITGQTIVIDGGLELLEQFHAAQKIKYET